MDQRLLGANFNYQPIVEPISHDIQGIEKYFESVVFRKGFTRTGKEVYTCKVAPKTYFIVYGRSKFNKELYKLDEIDWVCIQSRRLEDDWVEETAPQKVQLWSLNRQLKDTPLNFTHYSHFDNNPLNKIVATNYEVAGMGHKVALLHDPKKNGDLQYSKNMKLIQAINTYMFVMMKGG